MTYENERKLDLQLSVYVDGFVRHNRAAQTLKWYLEDAGVGFDPLLDHLTFRTLNVDQRAMEFLSLGYTEAERLEYGNWWAKVYRKPGYPALFIDQAFDGERGAASLIAPWVQHFGEHTLHHAAIRVENIERAIERLKLHGVECQGKIVGERGGPLRQIFTMPEERDGQPFTVLELTERHYGFAGFSPPQAEGLMQSTAADFKRAA